MLCLRCDQYTDFQKVFKGNKRRPRNRKADETFLRVEDKQVSFAPVKLDYEIGNDL